MSSLGVLADHHRLVSCLAITTYLCWLRHSPSPDKKDYFVCLLTLAFLSTTVWVFSLAIPHGMHFVVSTHPCFFWVICHPNRTLPLKESKQKPQNRLSLFPTARPYPLLPLTHDPPFLYWLGTGWWCLGFAHTPLLRTSKACPLLMRLPCFEGSSVHSVTHL